MAVANVALEVWKEGKLIEEINITKKGSYLIGYVDLIVLTQRPSLSGATRTCVTLCLSTRPVLGSTLS